MRNTVQRQLVIDAVLAHAEEHPTAEDIYLHISKTFPKISKATVYRNLHSAVETGDILPTAIRDGSMRFCAGNDKHFHFVCTKCNGIFDVPPYQINPPSMLNAYNIHELELTFKGICPKCKDCE